MTCTNADLGRALGLSHSTVSRMRTGQRTGSLPTLRRLAALSGKSLEAVADAAIAARDGDTAEWTKILDSVCGAEAPAVADN